MKAVLLSLVTLIGVWFKPVSTPYVEKMKSALEEMAACRTADDYKKVQNTFQRISKMEPKEWLPLYYMAQIQGLLVYIDATATIAQKDEYIDLAEKVVTEMEKINSEEAEIQVLKAWLLLSRMGLDPQTRGQQIYPSYLEVLNKAVTLSPENPRVKYMVLTKEMGEANFFAKSTTEVCRKLKTLHETWDAHSVVSEIHPQWGKQQVEDQMKVCN